MNYTLSLTESPVNFGILQVFYTEKVSLMCADCGCQFHSDEVDSSFVHSTKVKRKPFQYGARGNKIFHVERCPICTGSRLTNLKSVLQ